jgi:raffinose/stachyose/melibiose transport system substrate-binding protein
MRERIFNSIGIGLLVLCFVVSLGRLIARKSPGSSSPEDGVVTIRLAHWQLENGVREAFDQIAAAYTQTHPNVRVVQIPIPERIFTNWLITQLVGETAPDLIQVGLGNSDERLARYFTPLTDLANAPNPYNRGTPLENVILRDTFFDGMAGGFNYSLLEYYGVPLSGHSTRIYYNLDLLEEMTGSEELPRTYDDLIDLCRKSLAFASERKMAFVPIAGSQYNSPKLMDALFSSQTQRLCEKLNPPGRLGTEANLRCLQFLTNEWNLQNPSYRSGLELMREVGQYMQPGFLQLNRDDATLLFVQKRALMICTGSWDSTSIRGQARFKIGVGPIPMPDPSHPRYGQFTLGEVSEAGHTAAVSLGLTRNSPHPDVARDFLLFLASQPVNQIWTDTSDWIPSIIGVHTGEQVKPFLPRITGSLPGFYPAIEEGNTLPEVRRLIENHFHLLVGPHGSADAFLKALEPDFRQAITASMERRSREILASSMRSDTQWAALAWLSESPGAMPDDRKRWDIIRQSLPENDRAYYRNKLVLEPNPAP